jgi:cysteine-rich repeat protein
VKANVSGSAQKGPFSNGSQVSISELDVNLVQTGRTFSTTMNDDGGSYSVRGVQLGTPYARVEVNGFYFDEVRGQLSASPLSLFSYVDLSDRTTSNINLLGHLEAARLEHLVAEEGVSFGAAKAQAHREVLEMFQLDPDAVGSAEDLDISKAGEGNAALFAISVMLQGTRTVAELSELLSNIQSDLGSDGTLDNAANGSALMAGATMVDLAHARENLAARFDTLGVDATVPDITGQVSRFAETAPYVYTGGGIDYPIGMSRPNLLDPGMARFDFDAKFPALGFAVVLPEVSNVKIRITNHASNDAQTPTSIWYYGVNSTLLDWTVSNYDFDTGVQEFTSKHSGPGDLESFGFMGSGSATLEYFENGGSTPARTKEITWSGWESFGGTTVPDGRPIGVGTGGYGGTTGTGGSAGDGSGGYAGDGAGGAGGYAGDPNLPPDDGKVCGDGVRGPGEQCDDGNRVGGDGCGPSCLYEAAPQFVCGNGVVEPGEDCDGTDTNGMTCAQLRPGTTGEPGCDPVVCRFQPTTCQDACGNGVIDQGEDCDGANLNGMTCATYMPGTSGELQCEPGICRFDSLSCEQTCGNGLLDQGEECDPGLPLSGCDQCDPSCHIMPISCP